MSNTTQAEAPVADPNATALVQSLTPELVRTLMQDRGYRVELAGDRDRPLLRSATNGVMFEVHFLNALQDASGHADMSFGAVLQVRGTLPLEPINGWNGLRRFSRLHLHNDLLVLSMDVSVLGGVTSAFLRAQIEIWDLLVHDCVSYLRDALQRLAAPAGLNGAETATMPGNMPAAPAQAAAVSN
ncbi:YbjN domain-containing protein [Reyranella sp. CPCC 100927]|uniref:YbjN domain-containing protein n=1 Tax=Reyranella sp. CPCC 100927 TaxID=2599616 RepID=UPI0011B61C46|nr:YbjN domain-containing protein [Reyranella sp. CPCC 100927]TWT03898.1 YbjN domain-containing protein [Reyranella sp. CPCC 100927]